MVSDRPSRSVDIIIQPSIAVRLRQCDCASGLVCCLYRGRTDFYRLMFRRDWAPDHWRGGPMGFIEEFKRAYSGDDTQHFQVAGKQVQCPHCGGNNFDTGTALLNTTGLTL